MATLQLMTLDPAHFHAALVQKEMYPEIHPRVHLYAPVGADLLAHLTRVVGYNTRASAPTSWQLEVHACADYFQRCLQERPGQVLVLAGRNHRKIDYILAAVEAGVHVLADKPWILVPSDLPKVERALNLADEKGLLAYDIMTERFEITSILQRALLSDAQIFGTIVPGSVHEPSIVMESMHYLMKLVSGVPNRRPASFFDVHQQGEALSDVGTHLVDLVAWQLFPDQSIAVSDVSLLAAKRWHTLLTKSDFATVTGEATFPAYLASEIKNDELHYYCNTSVDYSIRGIHAQLNVLWDFQAKEGTGDTHLASFRGSRSQIEIRQGPKQNYCPELYVVPNVAADKRNLAQALQNRIAQLQGEFPGVELQPEGESWWVKIPARYRTGHEAHFAEVTRQFLRYLQARHTLPAWEKPNMLSKYAVTTQGVDLARRA